MSTVRLWSQWLMCGTVWMPRHFCQFIRYDFEPEDWIHLMMTDEAFALNAHTTQRQNVALFLPELMMNEMQIEWFLYICWTRDYFEQRYVCLFRLCALFNIFRWAQQLKRSFQRGKKNNQTVDNELSESEWCVWMIKMVNWNYTASLLILHLIWCWRQSSWFSRYN